MLYPSIPSEEPDQRFRLARISELDAFLAKEAEDRRKTQKKYLRVVNIAHGLSTGVGIVGIGLEAGGISMIATGVGTIPGIVLSALGASAFLVDLACAAVIRKCTKKAMKHAEIMRCANDKLQSIHKYVSEALRDGTISAEEYNRIVDEVSQYQHTKDNIRAKAIVSDEGAKKELLEKGREEARADFVKYMANFSAH